MSAPMRNLLLTVLAIMLVAGAGWYWIDNLQLRSRPYLHESDAARENPMLAATLLLRKHGHTVTVTGTLAGTPLATLPAGTLIIADPDGIISSGQAQQLLAWVRRGNTLITRPRARYEADGATQDAAEPANPSGEETGEAPESADSDAAPPDKAVETDKGPVEIDPLGAQLGVGTTDAQAQAQRCGPGAAVPKADAASVRLSCMTLWGSNYPVEVDTATTILVSLNNAATPAWSDPEAEAVRVYSEGEGHIVMVARNYFNNGSLQHYDHGELLLALVGINRGEPRVFVVQRLDMTPWYLALWGNFKLAIISLGAGAILLFWKAVPRFGPLLPEPARERRSLIEHIDASGAWLWKVAGGRDILLAAVRGATLSAVQRRAPELRDLPPQQQVERLALLSRLPAAALQAALLEPPARLPREFTRQIRTLQELRNLYERQQRQ
jgi:hypothetical protein